MYRKLPDDPEMSVEDVKDYVMKLLADYPKRKKQTDKQPAMSKDDVNYYCLQLLAKHNIVKKQAGCEQAPLKTQVTPETADYTEHFTEFVSHFDFGPCLTKTDRILEWLRLFESFQHQHAKSKGKRPVFGSNDRKKLLKGAYETMVLSVISELSLEHDGN